VEKERCLVRTQEVTSHGTWKWSVLADLLRDQRNLGNKGDGN